MDAFDVARASARLLHDMARCGVEGFAFPKDRVGAGG